MLASSFDDLLDRDYVPAASSRPAPSPEALATLAEMASGRRDLAGRPPALVIEALIAEIDRRVSIQLNGILHADEFQVLEARWRGLHYLVRNTPTDASLKIKFFDISQKELSRTLRKFRGTAWDQSPIFKKVYEEEYGQLGGEPYGLLIGDYYFDHKPEDIQLISDMAMISAAAHVPFLAGVLPSIMQMDSWTELANPRDLSRLFQTAEYAAWRSLRGGEDTRYVGLCLPRFLLRVPYGNGTDPLDEFAFEEDVEGPDPSRYLWGNAIYTMAANVTRAFSLYGWCTHIRGVETGGIVDGLTPLCFSTADGDVDGRSLTEIAISERREAELSRLGFIALLHRRGEEGAFFDSAQTRQKPQEYDDPAATANAAISARLPYLFASCRFAHYLKCMVRDKVGSSMTRQQVEQWMSKWLRKYVDGAPTTSSQEWKASHPLEEASITLEGRKDSPGQLDAKIFLKPHYQLEGLTAMLRLVSRLPAS